MSERRSLDRRKNKFTAGEDARLLEVVSHSVCRDWLDVAVQMEGRSPRQCRERWNNYVNPSIVTTPWTDIEERLLESKFAEFGPRWQIISGLLPGRSKNHVRNHWMTKQRRLNKKRKVDIEAISSEREQQSRLSPPPDGTQNQLDAAEELFQPEAEDDTLWEIISFDYL
jgi:hypothetical protein